MFTYDRQKSNLVSSDVLSGVKSRSFSEREDLNRSVLSKKSGINDFSSISILPGSRASIQPKLKINAPNDRYEQEADGIADQVMHTSGQSVQRACHKCRSEEEHIQTKTRGHGERTASADFTHGLAEKSGGGQALDTETRGFMESGMGTDFSKVRIHTDSVAARLNDQINARAFTHNHDIYFNRGEYEPESAEGKRLLAHELVHTVQQQREGGIVQKEDKKDKKKKKEKKKVKHDVKVEVVSEKKKGKSKVKGKTEKKTEEKIDKDTTATFKEKTGDSDKEVSGEVKRKLGKTGFHAGAGIMATQSFTPGVSDRFDSYIKVGGKWNLLDNSTALLSTEPIFKLSTNKGPQLTWDNRLVFFPNGTLSPEIAAMLIFDQKGVELQSSALLRYHVTDYFSTYAGITAMWNSNDTMYIGGTAGLAFYLW